MITKYDHIANTGSWKRFICEVVIEWASYFLDNYWTKVTYYFQGFLLWVILSLQSHFG